MQIVYERKRCLGYCHSAALCFCVVKMEGIVLHGFTARARSMPCRYGFAEG
jgi:hypothetical protein